MIPFKSQICFIEEQAASVSKNTDTANNLILVFMVCSFNIKISYTNIVTQNFNGNILFKKIKMIFKASRTGNGGAL